MKTLVIILSETRAFELTFNNFKENVIDILDADLALCIGVKQDYNYENPFYKLAKYHFLYDEPDDYSTSFDYAYNKIINNNLDYEIYNNSEHKRIYWRQFLKIKDQFLGGIKDDIDQHPGSAGILIFFRWFLLKNLINNNLINIYDRFIITRSDFIYQLPHPKMSILDEKYIWIPNSEYYGGYTDRHVILSKNNIELYLNILNNMVLQSNKYFNGMNNYNITNWNLEKLIKFHLEQNNISNLVKHFPYISYAVRNIDGTTRWSKGTFSDELGYYIKYSKEYDISSQYKNKLNEHINNFYEIEINNINETIINETIINKSQIKDTNIKYTNKYNIINLLWNKLR